MTQEAGKSKEQEAAEKFYPLRNATYDINAIAQIRDAFVEGAKWNAQQIEQPCVRVSEQKPVEDDGMLLVTNGDFSEMVWFEDSIGLFQKPMRYDEDDTPIFRRLDQVTHWMKLPPAPPKD